MSPLTIEPFLSSKKGLGAHPVGAMPLTESELWTLISENE